MARVSFFIDGFNLYHSIENQPSLHKYKWLNLRKLSKAFISRKDEIAEIYYFSAYAKWLPSKEAKHKLYINALRSRGKADLGRFSQKGSTLRAMS